MANVPPSQSSIDGWNTTTPNLADIVDIEQCTYMHGRHTPQVSEHRCLEYCYTKLGRYSRYRTMHIYAWQTYPPPIDNRSMADHYTEYVS